MEVQSWNIQGRSLDDVGEWLGLPRAECMDVVLLQEVGGIRETHIAQDVPGGLLKEVSVPEDSELVHYHVLSALCLESHLSQVILIDRGLCDVVRWGSCGKRTLEVCFSHGSLGLNVLVIGVHFPHRNHSNEVFQEALLELEQYFKKP